MQLCKTRFRARFMQTCRQLVREAGMERLPVRRGELDRGADVHQRGRSVVFEAGDLCGQQQRLAAVVDGAVAGQRREFGVAAAQPVVFA